MALFWFFAGVLTTIAARCRGTPVVAQGSRAIASLPAFHGGHRLALSSSWLPFWRIRLVRSCRLRAGRGPRSPRVRAAPSATPSKHSPIRPSNPAIRQAHPNAAPPKSNAGSMNSAIASLESRLAKGGGTDGDWELLAKSFEFLGRPADAAKARARQLPPVPADEGGEPSVGPIEPAHLVRSGDGDCRSRACSHRAPP